MSENQELSGPDLAAGVAAESLKPDEPLLGHAAGEAVMLVRHGDEVFATGASCTHYGGPLAEGLAADGAVRCPWHHACFDLRTGRAIHAPALAPIACYEVIRAGATIKVGARREIKAPAPVGKTPASVVIVGAGPAGTACAVELRQAGYEGAVTLLGGELPGPVDRPNLSKDFLAGNASEDWIPLRTKEALAEQRIELIANDPVTAIDAKGKSVRLTSGKTLNWAALVLATGAEPVALSIEGSGLRHVHLLRTLADARSIIAQLPSAKRAVVIGSGFIGLEAAASLRQRGLEVTVMGSEPLPLGRILGEELGQFIRGVHEEKGVRFRLGVKPSRITERAVELPDGSALEADLVIVGIGVRPRTALAESAGLKIDRGIVVDDRLRTAVDGIFAIGDVARFPYDGQSVRIEHFALAERHGQSVARALTGDTAPFRAVPFFWSQHHDVILSSVGHAEQFDPPEVRGSLAERDAMVVYRHEGRVRSVVTIGRDRESLAVERALELRDAAELERLASA